MKRLLFTSIICLLAIAGYSQPIFNAANCFQVGDSSKIGFSIVVTPFTTFLGETGSNHTWDFSTTGSPGPWTNWASPTASYKFQASTESIHTTFANTQINEYAALPFARDLFYTYSPSQDTLYLDGLYTSNNYHYTPHIPYLSFPLMFNDSVYTNTMLSQGPTTTGYVSRYWIYDGYGTLKLPYGNVANVARIRTKQIDTSTVISMVLSRNEELIWFNLDTGIPVLRVVKQGETAVNAYYASAEIGAGIEINRSEDEITIYPNPVNELLKINNITWDNPILYLILDASGRTVLSGKIGTGNFNIDVSDLKSGIYSLNIESRKAIMFIKN